jgi:hypothetical protein
MTGVVAAAVAVGTRSSDGLEAVRNDVILAAAGIGMAWAAVLAAGLWGRRRWARPAAIVTFGGAVVVGTVLTVDVVQRVAGLGGAPLRDVLLPVVFLTFATTALVGAAPSVPRRS